MMRPEILTSRLEELGWSSYRLAQEVARVREELYNESFPNPRTLISTLERALEDPDKSSHKTIECIVKAMNGTVVFRWAKTDIVVTGYEEVS